MPSATETTVGSQAARTRAALASVAWAFLAALARTDNARANELLVAFQTLWNANRSHVIAGFTDAAGAARVFPSGLTVDGRYGPQTRLAVLAILTVNESGFSIPAATLQALPSTAPGLASWYRSVSGSAPGTSSIWRIDTLARATPANKLYAQVLATVSAMVAPSSGPAPGPSGTLPAPPPATGGPSTPSRAPDGARPTNPTIPLQDQMTFEPNPRGKMPLWGWILLAVGGATATGGLIWAGYRFNKYGKVFR